MKQMKSCLAVGLCLGLLVLYPLSASAQEPSENPLSDGQRMLYESVKGNIVRSAEKMPEEQFEFKPVPEVRSFRQILGHVGDTQYLFCSPILGQNNQGPGIEQNLTGKAEVIKALKEAFAYCDKAYNSMTDAQASQLVNFFGGDHAKLTLLSFNTTHINDHYGNLVTYMRINGLVPPSSESRGKPKQ